MGKNFFQKELPSPHTAVQAGVESPNLEGFKALWEAPGDMVSVALAGLGKAWTAWAQRDFPK